MKIVLMADNRKNELLVNFCIAYRPLLMKHQLISVYNTGKLLRASVDLEVSGLSVDYSSEIEQLARRAQFNEIDCVIYLRDGSIVGEHRMPKYGGDDIKERRESLTAFLEEMGW